jgi:hypothetical protein
MLGDYGLAEGNRNDVPHDHDKADHSKHRARQERIDRRGEYHEDDHLGDHTKKQSSPRSKETDDPLGCETPDHAPHGDRSQKQAVPESAEAEDILREENHDSEYRRERHRRSSEHDREKPKKPMPPKPPKPLTDLRNERRRRGAFLLHRTKTPPERKHHRRGRRERPRPEKERNRRRDPEKKPSERRPDELIIHKLDRVKSPVRLLQILPSGHGGDDRLRGVVVHCLDAPEEKENDIKKRQTLPSKHHKKPEHPDERGPEDIPHAEDHPPIEAIHQSAGDERKEKPRNRVACERSRE